jgi:phosphate transport system substrate-binding protein
MFHSWVKRLGWGFVFLGGVACQAQAETLTVGGTGSSAPLVRLLFDEFRKQSPDVTLAILSPPLGSGGAMRALSAGHIDMAVIGRPLTPEEVAKAGTQFALADTPLVFATPDGQRPKGFTLDELARVYAGALNKWDSGQPIRLVLRASFESDTLLIRSMSPALAEADTAARQRPGMQIGDDDLNTLALLTQTPAALGSTTLGLLHTSGSRLQVLPLNGVMPSVAALKNGSYPWRKPLLVVLAPKASPAALSFARFLRTGKAQALLLRNDYLPINP